MRVYEEDEGIGDMGSSFFSRMFGRERRAARRERRKKVAIARRSRAVEAKRRKEEGVAKRFAVRGATRKATMMRDADVKARTRAKVAAVMASKKAITVRKAEVEATEKARKPRRFRVEPVRPRKRKTGAVGARRAVIVCGTSIRETEEIARNLMDQYPGRVFQVIKGPAKVVRT